MEERKRLIVDQETDEDVVISLSLRPSKLEDFIGQKKLIESLRVSLQAAKQRNEPVEHMLFSGPPGLGKTTLAYIVAHEMETRITVTSGPAIDRAGDLIGILTNLEKGDVLFIDEIHRLSKTVEEFLYPAMENSQIDFIVDKGPYARTIKFNLKPFTLIGATTRSGLLTSPLRDRFGIFHHLDFYNVQELGKIVMSSAKKLNLVINKESAEEIAKRARGTPRVANRLLRRVRDYAQVKTDDCKITKDVIQKSMETLGIDEVGLDGADRRFVEALLNYYKGGPVGIETLAATLNEEVDTIADVVEPFLIKIGFLHRTSRGRQLTETALKHLKNHPVKSDRLQKELF